MDNKLKLEFPFATLLTSKDADDVVALASIENRPSVEYYGMRFYLKSNVTVMKLKILSA
jgi:hypothetical protein